jgi:hypothetical protein
MPAYSTLRAFIDSLRTGETNITQTFARALAAEGVGPIGNRDSVDPKLSDTVKGLLRKHHMKPAEIEHVDEHWTGAQRNEVREWILAAVAAGRDVTFSWELFAGSATGNRRDDPGAPAPVSITFLSPREGVNLHRPNFGQINVDR